MVEHNRFFISKFCHLFRGPRKKSPKNYIVDHFLKFYEEEKSEQKVLLEQECRMTNEKIGEEIH